MSIQRLSNAGQSGFRYKTLIAGITPVASVPVIGEATALTFSTASVTFTAPGAYAGSTFTATSSPGGLTGTSATSPITISGLSEQTAYTFTVTATNATGTSGPSAASNSVTTPIAWAPEGAYDSLATVTVGAGGVSSITFAGIPNTYKHLQIRTLVKFAAGDYGNIRFNGDTTASNYRNHILYGIGSGTPSAVTAANAAYFPSEGRSSVGVSILDILDYSNTTKNKVTRELGGFDTNGAGQIFLTSNLWMSTAAINSISVTAASGTFTQYTQFSLYGVR